MIHSLIFSDGKLVGRDLETEAIRLVRADKGLVLWVDLDNPTDEEIKTVLTDIFQFHPLAVEDCVTPSPLPKIDDYEDYLFLVMQALTFAKHARDRGGTFLVICLVSFFIFHIFINVAMQIGLLPTTGIPLPLMSYGGSAIMMFLIAIGLMLNVDMRRFVNE